MFRGESYNNQERPNISHGKVLTTCVAILGAQPNTIRLINEMLCMPVNRDYVRAKNRAAHNIISHQLEKLFATTRVGGKCHDTVFNSISFLFVHKYRLYMYQKYYYLKRCGKRVGKIWSPSMGGGNCSCIWGRFTTRPWLGGGPLCKCVSIYHSKYRY